MKQKLLTWLKRYLPAEILGTASAVGFPTIVALFSSNNILIAYVGTWGENLGFYGTMIVQEVLQTHKRYHESGRHYGWRAFAKDLRNIFLEFGVAESLDSLLVRPGLMYLSLAFFDNLQIGILAGKILADVVFYIPTAISFELRRKYLGD